jgi:hypothetical protein
MSESEADAADGTEPPAPSTWQRFRHNPDHESLSTRLKDAMLRPAVVAETRPDSRPQAPQPTTVEELEAAVAKADDKERLVGLLLAPVAGLVAIIVTSHLISSDPKATYANGLLNHNHVSPSLYLEVGGSAFVLAMLMVAMAWWRKRLFLGIVMGLYGLSIFNLHFWGFGIPYLAAAGWYLVRHYRVTQKLKLAREAGGGSSLGRPTSSRPTSGRPNKRYTPPTAR